MRFSFEKCLKKMGFDMQQHDNTYDFQIAISNILNSTFF